MSYTRRTFLKTTAAVAAAAGFRRSTEASRQASGGIQQAGAPGVDLTLEGPALPDYTRDLERYLVRLANDARERRKRIINAISTRQGVLDRQKAVVAELLRMLGGPFERAPLNPRVTGSVERPGYRIEKLAFESRPRLYVTANLYLPTGPGRRPAILSPLGHS
ncbi:MAG TPA: twin-arginine translocation signal domain-containing protein, partial [Vicinamibacterales bacterium]